MKSTNRIKDFFFTEEVPYGLGLVRILLPLVLLQVMIPRWFHARELYSSDGAAAPLSANYGYIDLMPIPSGTVAVILATILVFTLITTCLGWCTRASVIITTVLFTYLNLLDCMASLTKYSVIASHGLLILCLSNCGAVWSLDNVLRRKRDRRIRGGNVSARHYQSSAWPRRLMQIMIGVVYLGAAFTKMHTPAFFSGDQMRNWMLTNVNHSNPFGEYLSFYPAVLVVSAYITILWEILFLFLAWKGARRVIMISLGVFFHIGTSLVLGLYIFPLVCFSIYFAFVEERDVRRFRLLMSWLSVRCSRLASVMATAGSRIQNLIPEANPRQAATVFGVTLLVLIFGGVELEYRLDPFGINRAEGAYELKEIEPERVRRMLAPTERIREQDKFLTFEIGTDLLSDVLIDRQSVFRHGETLIAQCVLTPPHEDMWIECNLHDAHEFDPDKPGRIIDQVGQIVDRTTLRASYAFNLMESLPPGRYFLVIRSAGREITKRPFELRP